MFSSLFLKITVTDSGENFTQRVSSQGEAARLSAIYWSKSHNPAVSESLTTRYVSAWSLGLKDAIVPVLVL